jgi:hypothetical protein
LSTGHYYIVSANSFSWADAVGASPSSANRAPGSECVHAALDPTDKAYHRAERRRIIEAIQAGINNYMVKPFTAETLGKEINTRLATMDEPTAAT